MNAENLKATIKAYNSDAAGSGDRVFGTPADQMAPFLTAPFYAVRANATVDETNLSLYDDDNMNVLMSKEGEPIVNLYAAGGVVGINLPEEYGLGFHIMSALTSGAYAGNCVRESLIDSEK